MQSNHNYQRIKEAKLLIVGAGGIGCELLKCLIMSGFKNISIADMDTIEKSNLNRQFLFNAESIGQYKSETAVKAIEAFRKNSSLKLKAYVGNIKDKALFNKEFFNQYDLILNALDNLDTRYYMNLICMKNNIPLINSGSEGYLGSIGCHMQGLSPCYNCSNKVRKKTIPICSIRLHPEKIEHCVAWGKALFERLFSVTNDQNKGNDDYIGNDSLNHDDIINTLQQLFNDDIISLENKRKLPLDIINILSNQEASPIKTKTRKELFNAFINSPNNEDETNQSIEFLINILYESYEQLLKIKPVVFDKENDIIINFIFASSNLRAENFYISQQSKFKIKEIAGNIIPAISATNSIVASIQVIECIKTINGRIDKCKNVGITKSRKIVSSTSVKEAINLECFACSNEMIKRFKLKPINIHIDMTSMTLDMFIRKYCENINNEITLTNFTIEVNGDILYEAGDNLEEEEIRDYLQLRNKLLSSFIFYQEMHRHNKEIEILILNSATEELIVKYQLHQISPGTDKVYFNRDQLCKENNSLLGKKRTLSI